MFCSSYLSCFMDQVNKMLEKESSFFDGCGTFITFIFIMIIVYNFPGCVNTNIENAQTENAQTEKTVIEKFISIDVDLAEANIDTAALKKMFKKEPLGHRQAVERHKRKRFILINREQEQGLSRQIISAMESMKLLSNDKKIAERCNAIYARLVKVLPEGFTPHDKIYILDTDEINAFCLPDGTVIVCRGLAQRFNDEELAWVIAHELGHGTAHHTAEKLSKTMIQDLAIDAFIDKESTMFEIVGTKIVRFFANMKYSRIQEDEADRLGLYYVNKAGFDMNGAISVLNRFKKESGKNSEWDEWFSTHPHPDNRLKNVETSMKELKENPDHTWGGMKDDLIEAAKLKAIDYYMKKQKK